MTVSDPPPGHLPKGSRYRPEIEGLRALAVLPVMLFHAGFDTFSGGYVGVDIFFVISGYLITTILVDDHAAGRFSILDFYERRARRILPALFVVIAVCIPFAWRWMLPVELADFGRSLVAVVLFVSNVLFWRSSGYFDLAAESKPLLHTWSLGVEEQFYVVFPLIIAFGWRFGVRRLAIGLAIIAALSLAASVWLLDRDAVASFFLLPTRAWELLAGASLALAGTARTARIAPPLRGGLAAAGMIAIFAAVFTYDETTRFPGVAALLPVAGTLLVLAFANPATLAGRLLATPPMLWVGAISYSAYLWHQPLYAFARLMLVDHPPKWLFGLLLIGALALASLSYRFIEAPFRDRSRVSRRGIFTFALAGSLLLAGIGGGLVVAKGAPQRFDAATLPLLDPGSPIEGCPAVDAWLNVCRIGDARSSKHVVLLGDSHSYALRPALDAALKRAGRGGYAVHTSCHPIPGLFDSREAVTPARAAFCAEANRRLLAFAERPDVTGVVVAVRWTLRLYPLGKMIDAPAFDNGEGGVEGDTPFRRNLTIAASGRVTAASEPKVRAVRAYLARLAARRPTVLIYPIPEVGWTPQRINLVEVARGNIPPTTISTAATSYASRNAAAIRVLDGVTSPNLRRSQPSRIFCNTRLPGRCIVQADGGLFYADDDHLALSGARLVVADALRRLDR